MREVIIEPLGEPIPRAVPAEEPPMPEPEVILDEKQVPA